MTNLYPRGPRALGVCGKPLFFHDFSQENDLQLVGFPCPWLSTLRGPRGPCGAAGAATYHTWRRASTWRRVGESMAEPGEISGNPCVHIYKNYLCIFIYIYVYMCSVNIYIKNYIDDSYSFKYVDIYIYVCVLHERIKWYIYIDWSVCLSITRLWLIW
jgi:hypothetical protein